MTCKGRGNGGGGGGGGLESTYPAHYTNLIFLGTFETS